MQMGYEEIAVFDQYLSSSRVINGATVRCYMKCAAGPGKLVTLIAGICVQHSSEARLSILLLWPFVAARYHAIQRYIET